jgi:hypothetical protein
MKTLLAICLIAAAPFTSPVWAAGNAAPAAPVATAVTGEVLEFKDVEIYTYLRLKTKDGETWAAVTKAPVTKGAKVTIENVSVMENFESKTLKKTFPKILFGTLAGTAAAAPVAAGAPVASAKVPDATPVKVPKASGKDARTVAEIVTQAAQLKDKPVRFQAKIVKYNAGIMGKTWLHLRDGSGAEADGSNDILVTTTAAAKLGDVVTVSGVVRVNKDFGSGYSYKVLVEDATLQP